ncbi:MAG: hypothetical protein HY367_01755 [Candidatus Aenigmarchaeota archaeon]|nr:hypothetical protein [Candidatus Aenigmarchaeota archaeon]
MKHDVNITVLLVLMFLVAQVVGLLIVNQDIRQVVQETGETQVVHGETVIGPRPDVEPESPDTLILILSSVLIGTGLIFLIMRAGVVKVWKGLFFWAVFMTISVALGVFIEPLFAFLIALVAAIWKVWKPNRVIHNLTEMFMYAGLAVIFVPILSIFWMVILLLVISAYDAFAVWKSGHMVSLARFQMESKVFAGFSVSYSSKEVRIPKQARTKPKTRKGTPPEGEVRQAILGGGDIAFPLLFAGVVMEWLINAAQLTKEMAFLKALIIPLFVSIALLFLLVKSEKGKFYPAMPFLTVGCLAGLALVWLL